MQGLNRFFKKENVDIHYDDLTAEMLLNNGFIMKSENEQLQDYSYNIDNEYFAVVSFYKGKAYCFDIYHYFRGGQDHIHKCSDSINMFLQCLKICGLYDLATNFKK